MDAAVVRTRETDGRSAVVRYEGAFAASFVVLWSSGYLAGKVAVAHATPFTVLVVRFGAAAIVFGLLAAFARVARPNPREVLHSVAVGVLALALQFGGVYLGLALGISAGVSALVIGAMPLTTSLLAGLTGERVGLKQWIGLALGFAGVVLVVQGRIGASHASWLGYVATLVGLVGISTGTLYQKRFASSIDLRLGLLIQHAAATLVLLPLAIWHDRFVADWSPAFFASTGWLVVINSVGGFALLFVLLRNGVATRVATLFYLVPPVTALMSWLVLGEQIGAAMLAGLALVVAGVYLGTRR